MYHFLSVCYLLNENIGVLQIVVYLCTVSSNSSTKLLNRGDVAGCISKVELRKPRYCP